MKQQSRELILLRLLDEAYEKKAWHGPNLRGSLRGINARMAVWRPAAGRHNIGEISLHAAYWKYAVRRRITGQPRGSFRLAGSNWFNWPDSASGLPAELSWEAVLKLLRETHEELRHTVASFEEITSGADARKASDLIVGVCYHDIYHAGQIQLLKKLHASRPGRD